MRDCGGIGSSVEMRQSLLFQLFNRQVAQHRAVCRDDYMTRSGNGEKRKKAFEIDQEKAATYMYHTPVVSGSSCAELCSQLAIHTHILGASINGRWEFPTSVRII